MTRQTKSVSRAVTMTAASSRPTRIIPSNPTAKAVKPVKKTGVSGSKKRRGKPTGLTKVATTDRVTRSTSGRKAKGGKAINNGKTPKNKKGNAKKYNTKESDDGGIDTPAGAPKPKKVFNDELNNIDFEYEAEAIRDSKLKGGVRSYLVKWVGWPEEKNTWEPEVHLRNSTGLITEFDVLNPDKP